MRLFLTGSNHACTSSLGHWTACLRGHGWGGAILPAAGVASARPDHPSWCPTVGSLDAAALPKVFSTDQCAVEGRMVRDRSTGAVVPPRGTAVAAESYAKPQATSDELMIVHRLDGTVMIMDAGAELIDAPEVVAASSGNDAFGPECADDAGNALVYREDDTHNWFVNSGSIPAGDLSVAATITAFREGTGNIDNRRTDCNDTVFNSSQWGNRNSSLVTNYSGTTTLFADINPDGCTDRDQVNVVSFGARPNGILATACTWSNYLTANVIEADIEFDETHTYWTNAPDALGCLGEFDVEAVATHERGHSFGLDHVDETTHGRMTMSVNSDGACQGQERSLGLGDALVLGSKY